MRPIGIICEYNPFHLGHARQIRLVREQCGNEAPIVCVMSGNYVQRGEPAMWDKFARARAAVACGVDVVLELPITGVLQSAEGFARSGVRILSLFGAGRLCFGAESANADRLMAMAEAMDTPAYADSFRAYMDEGLPYAAARQAALADEEDMLSQPNNILGLEYCRAIRSMNAPIIPMAVTRTGSYYAAEPDPIAPSASAIRRITPDGEWQRYLPEASAACLSGQPIYAQHYGERAVLARLRALEPDVWAHCAHGSEGLWSKAMKAAQSQSSWEAIVETVKSKRYPRTRVQRLLLCAYLGITQEDLMRDVPYTRVLAVSQRGRTLLRQAKDAERLMLINPGQQPPDRAYYSLETRAADLYTLFAAPEFPMPCRTEQSARLF